MSFICASMTERTDYAPTEAQINGQATPARLEVYRDAVRSLSASVAARIDFLLVDWLGLDFDIIQDHRRRVAEAEIGLTAEDIYGPGADTEDRRMLAEQAATENHRFVLQSMRMQALFNKLLQELGDGALRPSANIPVGIEIDEIYRDVVAAQETGIEATVLDLLKARLRIILLRRLISGLGNAFLRRQYAILARAVDDLIVPPPRDLEQYALQPEKKPYLAADPPNASPLQSAIVEEAVYQLELKRPTKLATAGTLALDLKQEYTLLEEKLETQWIAAERTLRILLVATEYDRSQVRVSYGVALENIWANLMRKWIELVNKSESLDVLEAAFSAEVVDRMRQSMGILDSYANAAPVLAERLGVTGAPKKRDYRALLFSPSGRTFMRYYRLLVAIGAKGAMDKELTQLSSIVPYENVLDFYPPEDDKPEIPSRILEGDGELAGLGPEHDKLDQVEIFFERQMVQSGADEWAWADRYWKVLQREKTLSTAAKKKEAAIRLETAQLRLEEQKAKKAAK